MNELKGIKIEQENTPNTSETSDSSRLDFMIANCFNVQHMEATIFDRQYGFSEGEAIFVVIDIAYTGRIIGRGNSARQAIDNAMTDKNLRALNALDKLAALGQEMDKDY